MIMYSGYLFGVALYTQKQKQLNHDYKRRQSVSLDLHRKHHIWEFIIHLLLLLSVSKLDRGDE